MSELSRLRGNERNGVCGDALELTAVKEYLRLDSDVEDEYLNILVLLSAEICENYMRAALPEELPGEGRLPESVKQAQLMIIGYFFENREGTRDGIPSAVFALLDPYRKAAF